MTASNTLPNDKSDNSASLEKPEPPKRWMRLPKNSAHAMFDEVHQENDWCSKAGCTPTTPSQPGIPKGMFLDGNGVVRCSKCGWPRSQMIMDCHSPCIAPGDLAKSPAPSSSPLRFPSHGAPQPCPGEDARESSPKPAESQQDHPTTEIIEANLADYAKRYFGLFDQYRGAWLREMGGVIRPKHWEIDGFVLRMRDIYEKAQLVDRMKQVMVKKLKDKCTADEMFDEVFKMLAEDRHDEIPTN